jgi:thioredoxin-dependent peroxiredoxin
MSGMVGAPTGTLARRAGDDMAEAATWSCRWRGRGERGDGMSVGIGDRAPDFTLPGTGGTTYSLADFAGKPLVLVFYPGDDSPVCTKQLNSYNDGLDQFADADAHILGISPQNMQSKEAFSSKHDFHFPLLADTDKAVAAAYGTLGPIGFPRRSTFIIDGDGIIRYAHRAIAGLTYRPVSELIEELDKLR